MLNIPKAEQRYSETELDLQRKLEYDRGYADGRVSIVVELEKIKAEAEELITHCDSDYEFEEIYGIKLVVGVIDNHIKKLRGTE